MKGFLKDTLKRFLGLGVLTFLGLTTLASCNITTQNNTNDPTTPPTVEPTTPTVDPTTPTVDPTTPTVDPTIPTTPTDDEKIEQNLEKGKAFKQAMNQLNYSISINGITYLIDGYNCQKDDVFYEASGDRYNVYTLKDAEEQTYTKTETTDGSFAEILANPWTNVFDFANNIEVNRVDKDFVYVRATQSLPEYKLVFEENDRYLLENENLSFEIYDIGKTEVNIPTNIAKEEEYIIKDGKYNLINLKAALTDWMNGNNAENDNICYNHSYRNLKEIKLINFTEEGLEFYATTVSKSNSVIFDDYRFTADTVNDIMKLNELKLKDFVDVLYNTNATGIVKRTVLTTDTTDTNEAYKIRAKNVLARDGIDTKIVLSYETGKVSSNITYGDGLTYKMVCFCEDGNYYEYVVNALGKDYVEENRTDKFDVEQKVKVNVLLENLSLYEEDKTINK